MEKTW